MKKKMLYDVILNIVATAIPILIIQLVSLPIVANKMGGDNYGSVITLVSLFTLLSVPFGNVLNNIKLLLNEEYKKKDISGDFNILLTLSLIISSFMISIGVLYYVDSPSLLDFISIITIAFLILTREYAIVNFRIILDYKGILNNNLILGIGYLIGTYIFYLTGYGQLIYIVGSLLSLFYIVKKSNFIKESFYKTSLFKKASYNSLILFFSTFLKTLLNYADKLILFPLLGPHVVSIYYTATIFGKVISMMITPINGVILSYLTRVDRINKKKMLLLTIVMCVIGLLGYVIIILFSKPLLYLLYPDWAKDSLKLIYITSATAIVEMLSSVIHPFILRFNNINWQIFINGSNLVVFIISTTTLYTHYGLIGFCIGILVSSLFKLSFMIFIVFTGKRIN